MNELGLPPHRHLPDDVRDRALHRVLDGIDRDAGGGGPTRPPRRRLPAVVAAAAVVIALLVATVLAGTAGRGPDRPAVRPSTPITGNDVVIDDALRRCAAAVDSDGHAADYPPTGTWRATATLVRSSTGGNGGEPDVIIAINDAFVCLTGPSEVVLSALRGVPAGDIQITKLGPGVNWVVLNPKRRTVVFDPGEDVHPPNATAPVQLLALSGTRTPSDVHVVVEGSFDGFLPDAPAAGVVVVDRPSISLAPVPPGSTSLTDCLSGAMAGVPVALRHTGPPPAVAAVRADGAYAGFCATGTAGSSFEGGGVPPLADLLIPTLVAELGGRDSSIAAALIAVPPGTRSVEIATIPRTGTPGAQAACTTAAGLALCTLTRSAPVRVLVRGADDVVTAVPLQ